MKYFFKLTWALRALLYLPWFGRFSLPSYIGPPLFLMGTRRMFIGKRVRIFPGLRAECHGKGRIFIHADVSIGQGFHIIAADDLHIGGGCLISGNVFITDTEHCYEEITRPVFEQANVVKQTTIGENCFIGIGVCIQAGTTLGRGCVVGSNSVVRGDFPPHSVIVGAPARVVKRFNSVSGVWERADAPT